jgi:hypothetical protein
VVVVGCDRCGRRLRSCPTTSLLRHQSALNHLKVYKCSHVRVLSTCQTISLIASKVASNYLVVPPDLRRLTNLRKIFVRNYL